MKASLFLASALAATGLAAPSTSPQVAKRVTVTASELTKLDYWAEQAATSYCNSNNAAGALIACSSSACPTVVSNKAVTIASFQGSVTDIRGVVSVDPVKKVITVSFRGSSSVRNWMANVVFVQSSCSDLVSGCLVHTGFYTAWNEVATKVTAAVKSAKATYPSYSIGVTGHSLGGAVATLAAAYLRKAGYTADLYTFGSPRVGNKAFAAFTTSQSGEEYRVTHDKDPVPRLPPIVFNYRHTSPEWWLKVPSPTTTSQVKICTGYASISCNAGTLGLEVDDHTDYFGGIAACSAGGFNWKRDDFNVAATNITDEELEVRLNTWVAEDVDYVNSNNLETEA
ncbi:Alpha/Beta hydrolase protein [Copromyces sp. CBS 386.78]|nr:Alpha/Beta hydrolase protein [Copromyces sp. CBS 386.78]